MTNNKRNDTRLSPSLNIFVACFTTCCARLHLYEALELLGKHCLYYDADPIIFISRPGKIDPLLGDIFVEFKDKLNTGDSIVEIVSGGPRNYRYKTLRGKTCCKVRRFSLINEWIGPIKLPSDEAKRPRRGAETAKEYAPNSGGQ